MYVTGAQYDSMVAAVNGQGDADVKLYHTYGTVSPVNVSVTSSTRWVLLATVSAGLLLITLDNSILYTALPTLTVELGATGAQALWIINAYPLVMAGLLLGAGTLGDRFGHRRMFLIGLVVFGAASVLAAFSPASGVLIAARAVLAVGAACMMPATLALIRIGFDNVRERNLAIAVWGSIAVVGMALGPIVGGLLLEHFWWGSVFLVNVPVVLVALVATLIVAPRGVPDTFKRWDAISSLYALVALTGAVFAIKEAAHTPPSWPRVGVAAVAAVIGGLLFARRQRRLTDPLLELAVFKNAAFTAGVLAAAFAMFAVGGVQLVTTQRFQLVEDFSPLQAGLLVSVIAIGSLPTALLGGATLHRVGLRSLICGGFALATVGMVITIIGAQAGLGVLVVGLLVAGAGMGASMSVASTAIVGNVPARRAGMASSVEEVSYEFGSLIAVAVLGSLMSFLYSSQVTFPAGAPDAARESMAAAKALADGDQRILAAAATAFDGAFVTVLIVAAVVLAIATVVTGWLLRRYGPGSQASAFEGNEH